MPIVWRILVAFEPLINHSAFTFYSGAMSVQEIATTCAARGYGVAGLCDRNGLYAAVRFLKEAKRVGIKPILGAEITDSGPWGRARETGSQRISERRNSGKEQRPSPTPWLSGSLIRSLPGTSAHSLKAPLYVFARTSEGYSRLCALITRRNLEPERFDRVAECAAAAEEGHVALMASDVALLYALKKAGTEGGSLFARLSGDPKVDTEARAGAEWLGLPLIAAPAAFFSGPEGYAVHRVLRAIKHLPPEAGPSQYLLPPGEAASRFPRDPRALDAAGELALSCDVVLPLGDWLLPHPPIPAGETEVGRLSALSYAGLARRVSNVTTAYLSRLERELEVIVRLGFAGYFLVVEDIARFARREGIPNIGRGSGAGSLVSYCLHLTHVDPVAESLYFERFLNPERRNPPDIDLDFSWRERDHVIRHVYETYGDENVCMIATHNTFSARSGFREVGKAFAVPEEEIGVIARAVPHTSFEHFAEAIAVRPESRRAPLKERPWQDVLEVARWIDGFPRHLSVHCGGVVVSPVPLTRRLSLERAAKGVAITQCDMYDVEELGLVKIDLLGNRSLGVLTDAVASVRDHTGKAPPVFPPERTYGDERTNAVISRGLSMGCFYIESPGMRLLLQRLKTRTFPDLTAVSSIIRPGVSESGMMDAYVARRLGEEPPKYADPGLEPILRETFGVMVYQEDVIRVAHEFVGLSLGEADLLRRAMSGKYRSREEMDALTASFFEKGRERGVGAGVLAELWAQIKSFAGYAFCKAHSASFAQLSYQVAYLKAHHPAEFFAALVNNQGGFYGTAAYVEEARRWGLRILPPDVNASENDFAGRDGRLRCGFFTLRGLRPAAMDALYEERGEGPYRSFADLCSRLNRRIHRKEIEILIRAGACDSFGCDRGELVSWLRSGKAVFGTAGTREAGNQRIREGHENTLVLCLSGSLVHADSRPLSFAETLSGEVRALGYAVTAHPLTPMLDWAAQRGYTNAGELAGRAGGTARAWGQVITYKRIPTRKTGEAMAFATLEDPTGLTELVFFPKTYRRFGELITSGRPLVVEGKAENDRGGLTLTVSKAWAIRGVVVSKPVQEPAVCGVA
jgi:DNA polymerase-3 subunit alpha